MQTFYNNLQTAKESRTTYPSFLVRLTQTSLPQLAAWENHLAWGTWGR